MGKMINKKRYFIITGSMSEKGRNLGSFSDIGITDGEYVNKCNYERSITIILSEKYRLNVADVSACILNIIELSKNDYDEYVK